MDDNIESLEKDMEIFLHEKADKISEKIRRIEKALTGYPKDIYLHRGTGTICYVSSRKRLIFDPVIITEKSRPLIECKLNIRIEMSEHLDEFIEIARTSIRRLS